MYEQIKQPCERLLQNWQERREVANYYFNVLLRLSPGDRDAYRRHRELCEKLSIAQLALKHADDQLQSCHQEYRKGDLDLQ